MNQVIRFFFSTSSKPVGGNLFTWGQSSGSLGYSLPTTATQSFTPQRIMTFDNNVATVQMGPDHGAVITTEGDLYTFGSGSNGRLGHNDGEKNHIEPKKVEFFSQNNLKIKEVLCGERFTAALTTNGDVWTWGFGGRQTNFVVNLLWNNVSSLGHGDNKTHYTPFPVSKLRQLPPTKRLLGGHSFVFAINQNDEVYQWGKGDYGVFGDGENKSHFEPSLNQYFLNLKTEENQQIVQIKSANNFTIALFSDGKLHAWGANECGQMGIKNEIGVELFETAVFPVNVVNEQFENKKIVDFDIGEDCLVILLDSNEVYWSGMRMAYLPTQLKLPADAGKIQAVGACFRSLGVVTENNQIYMQNKYVESISEDQFTGVKFNDNKIFSGGDILKIGGKYRNRFAIVKQG